MSPNKIDRYKKEVTSVLEGLVPVEQVAEVRLNRSQGVVVVYLRREVGDKRLGVSFSLSVEDLDSTLVPLRDLLRHTLDKYGWPIKDDTDLGVNGAITKDSTLGERLDSLFGYDPSPSEGERDS